MSKNENQWKRKSLAAVFINVVVLLGLTTSWIHAQPQTQSTPQVANDKATDIPGEGTVQEPQGRTYVALKSSTPSSLASLCIAQRLAPPKAWRT